uniref:Uncharacterized protein n=1 Tax=Helianthus annuus TaxID=4232 RepID=A0A251RMR6_HELAN
MKNLTDVGNHIQSFSLASLLHPLFLPHLLHHQNLTSSSSTSNGSRLSEDYFVCFYVISISAIAPLLQ